MEFKKALVGVDILSPISDKLVEWLAYLKTIGIEELVIEYVIPASVVEHLAEVMVDKLIEEETRRAREKYAKYREFLESRGFKTFFIDPDVGEPAAVLASRAESIKADLVVVGSRGQGWLRSLLLGSVAQELAHISPKPVMIVKNFIERSPEGEKKLVVPSNPFSQSMLVAIDFHEYTAKVFECALAIAKRTSQKVYLLHVLEEDEEPDTTSELLSEYEEKMRKLGVDAEAVLVEPPKPPGRAIVEYSKRLSASLILVGPYGRGGSRLLGLFMGRAVDIVLRHSSSTVIVCK